MGTGGYSKVTVKLLQSSSTTTQVCVGTRCVHSPLTTCTHDRSKNRGKGVVFITCPRKFNVREIKKKRVFWSTVSAK